MLTWPEDYRYLGANSPQFYHMVMVVFQHFNIFKIIWGPSHPTRVFLSGFGSFLYLTPSSINMPTAAPRHPDWGALASI